MIGAGLLFGIFFTICGLGMLSALIFRDHWSPQFLGWSASLSSVVLLWAAAQALFSKATWETTLWAVPGLGELTLRADHLSALFVLVTGLVFLFVSISAPAGLRRLERRYSLRAFTIAYLALFASVVLVLLAGHALMFLLAWEAMSILSYLLVNYEHENAENTYAGYLMLAMGEAGTLAAAAAFVIMGAGAGSLAFPSLKAAAPGLGEGLRWAVFILSFLGFGVKAGLVPVNSWLPLAYTAAPSPFVPVLAGATLNLGLYGIIRVNTDLVPMTMARPGLIMLIVGTVSAFVGILYATTENDLKTMLAHSSVENAGIVTAGIGAGMVFMAYGLPVPAGIAFVAALYHMTNHSIYKSLLFVGTGAVEAQSSTRDLDRLGGLIRRMPWTALAFLAGSLSIAALPPFNGFVSEWLTLQALLRSAEISSIGVRVAFALCGAGLALTAALAVTCFVKAFAMGFLGVARSEQSEKYSEARRPVLVTMGLLGALCLLLGVLPTYVTPILGSAVSPLTGASPADALVPPFFSASPGHEQLPPGFTAEFHDLGAQVGQRILPGRGLVVLHRGGKENPVVFAMSTSYSLVMLAVLLGLTYLVVRFGPARNRLVTRRTCWDGGIRRLWPEMTYTATGFSNPVRVIFDAVFRPTTVEDTRNAVVDHFRTAIHRRRDEVHIMDRLILRPFKDAALGFARGLARLHHGRINAYIAYALLSLLAVLILSRLTSP